jgi:hypothetical protein
MRAEILTSRPETGFLSGLLFLTYARDWLRIRPDVDAWPDWVE